jgi:hypothetical protein
LLDADADAGVEAEAVKSYGPPLSSTIPIPSDDAPAGLVVNDSAPFPWPCCVGGVTNAALSDNAAAAPKDAIVGAAEGDSSIAGVARPSPLEPPSGW